MKKFYIQKQLIIKNLLVADSFLTRFKGLMLKKQLDDDSGLLLLPCNGIHTFFMCFNIDVCYLDSNNKIMEVFYNVAPWRMLSIKKNCHSVVELKSGTLNKNISLIGKQCRID